MVLETNKNANRIPQSSWVTVVLNKSEDEEKCEQLLNDDKAYEKLKGDPNRKFYMDF